MLRSLNNAKRYMCIALLSCVAQVTDMATGDEMDRTMGGQRMMEAARNELEKKSHQPLLIGVTVLTSMEQRDLAGIGLDVEPMKQVDRLAKLTQSSGLDGVVCSAREVALIRDVCGADFLTVTPGIRPEGSDTGDQKRVMTPKQAVEAGVHYMVIGRPISKSLSATRELRKIFQSIEY